jgi:quinol monooxygenase YgiN
LPAVEAETGTPLWLLLQSKADADTLFLVDLFKSEEGLDAHMKGEAAQDDLRKPSRICSLVLPRSTPSQVIASKGR